MTDVEKQELAYLLVERSRLKPFKHQIEAVQFFYDRPYAGNFSEMGTGKSKITIDTAQALYLHNKVDTVVVITDASIRSVWYDPELGELAKHLWKGLPSRVTEYHSRLRVWDWEEGKIRLNWLITNYDYVINEVRLKELMATCGPRTMLVLDESSAIKNHRAARTKACLKIRKKCGRVVLLNGTPIANAPFDMLSQGNMMHEDILECGGIGHFRARYAEMGGYVVETAWGNMATQVLKWKNLDDLKERFKPHVIRFMKRDCLDLPPKLPPVTMTVAMSPPLWKIYKEMRDEMVVWMNSGVASANQVIVKILRLSQITSGFLGGVENFDKVLDEGTENLPDWLKELQLPMPFETRATPHSPVVEIGTEKLDLFLEWYAQKLIEDPQLKLLVWCRFVPELKRLVRVLREKYQKSVQVEAMFGDQKPDERTRALRLLDPRTTCSGPGVVAATIGTGGKGHTFTAAHTVVNMSFDYSLEKYLQAMDRVDRIGQTVSVSYIDIAAVGPSGQKTVDHQIIKAREAKQDLATWTTQAWVKALLEE